MRFGLGRAGTVPEIPMRTTLGWKLIGLVLAAVSGGALVLGWRWSAPGLVGLGAVGMVWAAARVAVRVRRQSYSTPVPAVVPSALPPPPPRPVPPARRKPVDPADTAGFVEELLAQGRYALLLRRQIASRLDPDQFLRAVDALQQSMALVPDGEVRLEPMHRVIGDGLGLEEAMESGEVVRVDRFFLDRYPVTNRQYWEFVAAGAYHEAELWDPTVLPALLTFVDQTGLPGPRYWRDGTYEPGKELHPVVGICWYEAEAYARWAGKRLPTDAEWVKAAAWPINLSGRGLTQRRFPWGDTMDRTCANLWGSGPNATVPVDQFAQGVSVGGVYQLIGNVWEWTSGDFPPKHAAAEDWALEVPMKSIRGGAFDTYFENQATCQFQSADTAIARKHNIGFRCAVSVRDVALSREAAGLAPAAPPPCPEPAEFAS